MKKFKNDRIEFLIHQYVIKLVYDVTLTNQLKGNTNVNVAIEEDE